MQFWWIWFWIWPWTWENPTLTCPKLIVFWSEDMVAPLSSLMYLDFVTSFVRPGELVPREPQIRNAWLLIPLEEGGGGRFHIQCYSINLVIFFSLHSFVSNKARQLCRLRRTRVLRQHLSAWQPNFLTVPCITNISSLGAWLGTLPLSWTNRGSRTRAFNRNLLSDLRLGVRPVGFRESVDGSLGTVPR